MTKRVLFYDTCCPTPYNYGDLKHRPLGGTEATVLRVASALDAEDICSPIMWQHCDPDRFYPAGDSDVVVCLRRPEPLAYLKDKYPRAKHILWMHDWASPDLVNYRSVLENVTIVCVSDTHAKQVKKIVPFASVTRIYNPIDQNLVPMDHTEVDKNKLVFFSSPHKGLGLTIDTFAEIRKHVTEMHLYIANPGYYPSLDVNMDGVINLGALPHPEIINHVRSALCTFFMNEVFPETFGLVLAESNAVGTPCLTAPVGAAPEVLCKHSELIDVRNTEAVIKRILAWREARPVVHANPAFRTDSVIGDWSKLLNAV